MILNSKKIEKIVALSDVHFPEQHQPSLDVLLSLIKEEKPAYIILNGDIVDFYTISSFDRNPARKETLQEEIDMAIHFMARLRAMCPSAKIVYVQGNHEDRLRRFLWKNKEISNLRALDFDTLFNLKNLNVTSVAYGENYVLDDVIFTHGTRTTRTSSVSYLDVFAHSGTTGHTHKLNLNFKRVFDRTLYWIESGCLCNLNPDYVKGLPDWQHGFVFGYRTTEGVKLRPVPITDGDIFL